MKCVEKFASIYGREPEDIAFCPYRVCPLGAHSDHQLGKITGLAIDKGIHIAYKPKMNGVVELVSLQLVGWLSPANRLCAHNSREAVWQQNTYTRAGSSKPVCIASFAPTGERYAVLFPLPDGNGARVRHFVYEALFDAADGLNGYDSGMDDAVVYACASLLYTMFERYDAASAMLSQALAACGGQSGKQQ